MDIIDPNTFITQMGQDNNEEDSSIKKGSPSIRWDFFTPLEPTPNIFFIYSILVPEEELVNNLYNMATYHTIIRKIPRTII